MIVLWFEYLATKSELPAYLQQVKSGYIYAHTHKTAIKKLHKNYTNVLIVRQIP